MRCVSTQFVHSTNNRGDGLRNGCHQGEEGQIGSACRRVAGFPSRGILTSPHPKPIMSQVIAELTKERGP